jgi:hypothetical protein
MQYIAMSLLIIIYLIGAIIFTLQIPSQYQKLSDFYLSYSDTFSKVH